MNGPAKSTANLVNARSDGFSLDVGKGAIICEQGFDFRWRHTTYSFSFPIHVFLRGLKVSSIEWIMLRVSGWFL